MKCPICRKTTKLGEEGASTLPKAFHINNILEIDELLKKIPVSASHPECLKHGGKIKTLFCEKCEELICWKCSHEYPHHDHPQNIVEADEVFEKHLRYIRNCLQPVDKKIATVKLLLDHSDTTERKIRDQGEAVKRGIDQTTECLQELIRRPKQALIDRAETATHEKLGLHSLEREELNTVLAQLKSCKEFVEEKLRSQSKYQIQAAKKELIQWISDAHSKFEVSEPDQNDDTKKLSLSDLGSVKSTLIVNYHSVGLFSVDIPQRVLNGMMTEVSLITSLPLAVKSVRCTLENTGWFNVVISGKVKQVAEGHFSVVFAPEQPGLHELSVCIGGTHITGSPFKLSVMSIAEWRGKRLEKFAEGLKHPCGVAVTDDGEYVIVAESQRNCVTVFSSATKMPVRRLGRYGSAPGEFVNPVEVQASHDNRIFVKDKERIQIFTLEGLSIGTIEIGLEYGRGVAVLPCGSVLTAGIRPSLYHSRSSIIRIRPPKLKHWRIHLKSSELVISSFDGKPVDMAVDTKGRMYVLTKDYGIQIFKPDSEDVDEFAREANRLNDPHNFCIDSNNIVYVTDGEEVKMYTTEGWYLGSFGNHTKLQGVAVCKTTGDLYICKANGEVLVSRNKWE